MWIEIVTASLSIVGAAFLLYLASPNQKLFLRSLPHKSLGITGAICIVIALTALVQIAGSATSVFIVLTVLMLFWTVLPPLLVYFKDKQEKS